MMADARPSRFASAALGLSLSLGLSLLGCDAAVDARALDRVCATVLSGGDACETRGLTDYGGLSGDTVGIHLEDGSLVVHLAAVPAAHTSSPFDIHALAVAQAPDTPLDVAVSWGSCAQGCPASPPLTVTSLPTEPAWLEVAANVRGADPGAAIPYDARLTITGVKIDLVDLRFVPTP
jgi:hypothetical protein